MSGTSWRFSLLAGEDRFWLGAELARRLRALGVPLLVRQRVSLCVAELVTNAVKFARDAELLVEPPAQPGGALRILCEDHGPGITDPALASRDGFSEGRWLDGDDRPSARRGLGLGLGALARLGCSARVSRRATGGARVEVLLCTTETCACCAGDEFSKRAAGRKESEQS